MERMVQRAVDNMHLEVENIHVCYEDFRTGNSPFSGGVLINHVTAFPTDVEGNAKFVDDTDHAYRNLSLRCFPNPNPNPNPTGISRYGASLYTPTVV